MKMSNPLKTVILVMMLLAVGLQFVPRASGVLFLNTVSSNSIGLCFDRPVALPSATNEANYTVNAGNVGVTDVVLNTDGKSVTLNLSNPIGEFFSVCVSNIVDSLGTNINEIATGFVSENSSDTIHTGSGPGADPTIPGQVYTCFWDTFDITVDGSDIGGTNDHFHFIHQAYDGDFDARVLVTRLDFASDFSKAGLMARESLAPDSVNVFTCFTPVLGANEIQDTVRPTGGGDTTNFTLVPIDPADPLRWLRLTRVGDVFTAYYGTNGEDWVISGSTTQTFAKTLHVGLAATAQTTSATTTASFTDFLVKGGRPGDDIVPTLSISHTGPNVVLKWPRTPRSYALQVSTNLLEWGLLVVPIQLTDSNTAFQAALPIGLLGSSLFLRPERIDKLIPDIASIMVNTGMLLSPESGLTNSGTSGALCLGSGPSIKSGTAFSQTNSYVLFANPLSPTAYIDTLQSSTGVDTGLQIRNTLTGALGCNDDAATGVKASKRALPGATSPAYTKYTFVVGAISPGVLPTSMIKVWVNY